MNRIIMTLAATDSASEWDARYLLAISHLNFDHELHLICLPGAVESCHWKDKQWQALALYDLAGCHHINTAPPIDSTPIDWKMARLLLSENQPTLHLCHWQNMDHLRYWVPLIADHDVLLVFGQLDCSTINQIQLQYPGLLFHVVNTSQHPHIKPNEAQHINHQQWAKLIRQHQVVLTWN